MERSRDVPLTAGPALVARDVLPPILVVDDDPVAWARVAAFVGSLRLANPLSWLQTGEAALEHLLARGPPALILLDIHMEGMSGIDVLRWLRATEGFADVPVVMLTASADLDEVEISHALGAVSYLVKPVGFGALRDLIRELDTPWALLAKDDA